VTKTEQIKTFKSQKSNK